MTQAVKRVSRTLADGTVKIYTYDRDRKKTTNSTLGAVWERYRESPEWRGFSAATKANRNYAFNQLADKLRNQDVRSFRRKHIIAIRDALSHTPGRANMVVASLRAVLSWCVDREIIETNPAHKIRALPPVRPNRRWEPEEIEIFLDAAPDRMRLAMMVGLYTGQRKGDCLRMLWSDFDGRQIKVVQQKTGRKMKIPCHPALRRELRRADRLGDTILTTGKGEPWAIPSFNTVWRRALEDAGLAGLTFHGLRVTAATILAEMGSTVHQIASVTGHRTLEMVQHYTKEVEQIRAAKEAMDLWAGDDDDEDEDA